MNFFKKFGLNKTRTKIQKPVSRPQNWNKTIADLMQEMKDGKRQEVGDQIEIKQQKNKLTITLIEKKK
ncbi:hypothetical protein [Winogradskyella sp.]